MWRDEIVEPSNYCVYASLVLSGTWHGKVMARALQSVGVVQSRAERQYTPKIVLCTEFE